MSRSTTGRARLRFHLAFMVTAMVMLGIAVILPFSVQSIVEDVLGPAAGGIISVTQAPIAGGATDYCRLHLSVVALDESQLMAGLRLSGHCRCRDTCDQTHRIVIASIAADDADAEGVPPSVAVTLAPTGEAILENVTLPLRGHPVRYPFDHYDMVLGIAIQRVRPDGAVTNLSTTDVAGHVAISIQELLPRQTMTKPVALDPAIVQEPEDALTYAFAFGVSFDRPRYLRLLSVILVLLVAAAAAYAVFLRPLEDLVVNSGALVLGVWGVRGILTPGNLYYLTAIDVALSVVIIFLLGAITVRALMFIHDAGDMRLLRRRRRRD